MLPIQNSNNNQSSAEPKAQFFQHIHTRLDSFNDQNNEKYYTLENMSKRARLRKQTVEQTLTIDQLKKLQSLSQALKVCFQLRKIVEDHQFGYFFKYPVNPYKLGLKDYWMVIKRPIDLTTIKRKFFMGVYLKASQFNQDMCLMFNNSLTYNKANLNIITSANKLFQFYRSKFSELQRQINLGILSEKLDQAASTSTSLITKLSTTEMLHIFNQSRLQKFGRLLSFLNNRKKRSLVTSMKRKYHGFPVSQQENQRVYLNNLSINQIYDLLKQAKSIKSTDFDIAKLMNVQVDPLLEGYDQQDRSHRQQQQEIESDFQIEDEED